MKEKKQYQTAEAEVLLFEAKDIITVSGFVGAEFSFRKSPKDSE